MAVSFLTGGGNDAFGTSVTLNLTVASTADRVMFVGVRVADGSSITGVTWDGTSLGSPIAGPVAVHTGDEGVISVYRLIAPDAVTGDVEVTIDSSNSIVVCAMVFAGVDQTTPYDGVQTQDSSGSSSSVSVTSASGNMVAGFTTIAGGDYTYTQGADQTEVYEGPAGGGAWVRISCSYESGDTSVTHSYSYSGSNEFYTWAANVRAAGGGGGGSPWYYQQPRGTMRGVRSGVTLRAMEKIRGLWVPDRRLIVPVGIDLQGAMGHG